MTLRNKIVVYFVALHVVLAALAVFVVMESRWLLFAMEVLFAISIVLSYRLVRALFVPFDMVRTGAELISERDFTTRFVPVGQPELDLLVRVYNDMIDRLRDERLAAEEQQRLLAQLVQASPSGIVVCDFDGNVQQANPAAAKLLTPELAAQLQSLAPGESRLLPHQGARRLRAWRAEFRDRGFAKSFFLLDEMTEELRLTEKAAYETLIRMMSHEINNSTGAVRSLLESSLRYARDVREEDRDDFVSALTIASARIDALNRFMSGFADVVRIPPPHRTETRIDEVLQATATLLRAEAAQRQVTIEVDAEPTTAEVDRNQLEQVVLNVVRNALEAIGGAIGGGIIAIRLKDNVLTIADNGPGLDDEARAALFTPFFTTKRDGRGLGLTIVQEILTNHGLPFALENGSEGGACFRVAFAAHEPRQ